MRFHFIPVFEWQIFEYNQNYRFILDFSKSVIEPYSLNFEFYKVRGGRLKSFIAVLILAKLRWTGILFISLKPYLSVHPRCGVLCF